MGVLRGRGREERGGFQSAGAGWGGCGFTGLEKGGRGDRWERLQRYVDDLHRFGRNGDGDGVVYGGASGAGRNGEVSPFFFWRSGGTLVRWRCLSG